MFLKDFYFQIIFDLHAHKKTQETLNLLCYPVTAINSFYCLLDSFQSLMLICLESLP